MSRFDVIAFDADDTLWHNETLFHEAQARYRTLLARYQDAAWIDERLHETEMRNLEHFGYGVKGFALSMIETAIELTEGRITGREVQSIIDLARGMLAADIELLDGVSETVEILARTRRLMILTKGDLHDQERKLERSGLSGLFWRVEVVSDKNRETYESILQRHGMSPERFVMVGNSIRSDILPVLDAGGHAVYVPYHLTWQHEFAEPPEVGRPRYHHIDELRQLPDLLVRLETA